MTFAGQDSFFSQLSSLQPIQIILPINQADVQMLTIKQIPEKQIRKTMNLLLQAQSYVAKWIIIRILILAMFVIIYLYIAAILVTLSLFNIFFFLILLGTLIRYIGWIFDSSKNLRQKGIWKKMSEVIQAQNKRFYSRKLIRWELDVFQKVIIIHNLRIHD